MDVQVSQAWPTVSSHERWRGKYHPLSESNRENEATTDNYGAFMVYRVDSGYRSAMSVQSSLVMHPINEVRVTTATTWLPRVHWLILQLVHLPPVRLRRTERTFLTPPGERRDGRVFREYL